MASGWVSTDTSWKGGFWQERCELFCRSRAISLCSLQYATRNRTLSWQNVARKSFCIPTLQNYAIKIKHNTRNMKNIMYFTYFYTSKMCYMLSEQRSILQGRMFSYADTQRHRLGTNHLQIPVNRPINPVRNYQRDGPMTVDDNQGRYWKKCPYHCKLVNGK